MPNPQSVTFTITLHDYVGSEEELNKLPHEVIDRLSDLGRIEIEER